jgi:organic hydroperoxide reductase OsmC/OhrA
LEDRIVMHTYQAHVEWKRDGAKFSDNRYSRGHRWSFDGGVGVVASSSPAVVPEPQSIAAAVDPEEALVAALSSCHMLWFLSIAAKRGFIVDSYDDEAFGVMAKNAQGKLAITQITLRPRVIFSGDKLPDGAQLTQLHHCAHEECFIANSIRSEIVIEPR